jgi:hypothetical protein
MADTTPDLPIDISGNTASIATDYLYVNGLSAAAAHVQLVKMMWGTSGEAFRVSQNTPLPVNIYSTNPSTYLGISGSVSGSVTVSNAGTTGSFVYIKGSTGYQLPVTGNVQGVTNGVLVGITGTVSVSQPIIVGGAGSSGITVQPVAITGGRYLRSTTDTVSVTGSVSISGGRYLNAVTDTVSVLGSDLGGKVLTKMYDSSGATLNSTSNALNVYLTNAGFTATINVGASTAVYNYNNLPLVVAGTTAGGAIKVKGENGNAVEVTATTPLSVSVSNEISIDDAAIVDALSVTTNPLISTLTDIKTNTAVITSLKSDINSGKLSAKISEITRPTKVVSASKQVSTASTQLESNVPLRVGVTLKSNPANSAIVYIGGTNLLTNATDGYPLEPGESIYIECANVNTLYARSTTTDLQTISYIGS